MRPPACTPPRLPSRLPRRPAGPAARAPPRRLPPGDDPAVPARHRRAGRAGPQWPSTTGQPPAGPAHPPAARPAQGLDHRPAVAATGPPNYQPADPAPPCARGRLLAAAPPGRTRRPRPRPDPHRPPPAHPRSAHWCGAVGRGRGPQQPAAVGAGHLDPPGPAPADHDPRHQPAPHHLRRRRPCHGSLLVSGDPQGHQRQLHHLLRPPSGRLPTSASGGGGLRQRHHPPLQDRPAVAEDSSPSAGAARRPATAPTTPPSSGCGARSRRGWPTTQP
jgi:hypothetical protein